jgi:hypothetical protein
VGGEAADQTIDWRPAIVWCFLLDHHLEVDIRTLHQGDMVEFGLLLAGMAIEEKTGRLWRDGRKV